MQLCRARGGAWKRDGRRARDLRSEMKEKERKGKKKEKRRSRPRAGVLAVRPAHAPIDAAHEYPAGRWCISTPCGRVYARRGKEQGHGG